MSNWRTLTAVAVCAATLAGCGGTAATIPTVLDDLDPITFTLGIDDSGRDLLIRTGDEVVLRLPLSGPGDEGWVLTVAPNPAVLGGGDDILFFPSEPNQGGVAYHEFDFIAGEPGETTITLTHGFQQFNFTIQVAAARSPF